MEFGYFTHFEHFRSTSGSVSERLKGRRVSFWSHTLFMRSRGVSDMAQFGVVKPYWNMDIKSINPTSEDPKMTHFRPFLSTLGSIPRSSISHLDPFKRRLPQTGYLWISGTNLVLSILGFGQSDLCFGPPKWPNYRISSILDLFWTPSNPMFDRLKGRRVIFRSHIPPDGVQNWLIFGTYLIQYAY